LKTKSIKARAVLPFRKWPKKKMYLTFYMHLSLFWWIMIEEMYIMTDLLLIQDD